MKTGLSALTLGVREYQRRYAALRRDLKWRALQMLSTRCPRIIGRSTKCHEPLQSRLVDGETVPFCPRCECKRRGICIDCRKAPVDGTPNKAVRCAACRRLELLDAQARYAKRHPGRVRAQWRKRRKRMQADGTYQQMLERKRLWRLANPKAKKRYQEAWNRSEHAREYQRRYRAQFTAERRERERERSRLLRQGIVMTHPCVVCETPLTGRAKKCTACANAAYATARAVLCGAVA